MVKKNRKRIVGLLLTLLIAMSAIPVFAETETKVDRSTLVFADAGWDSVKFHNAVAGYIAKTVFGYQDYTELPAGSSILHEGLMNGQVDVNMEEWTDNLATYKADLAAGKLTELGVNFDDNIQGLYVPRYVIEGDPERGIKPMAPDLKTVEDLKKYKDLFPDDEAAGKGRLYGSIPGWETDNIVYNKYLYYGLDKAGFNYFRPGSEAAMNVAFSSAYDKGEPIVGYNWEPTWIMGKYDFVLLEDAPYKPGDFEKGMTAFPSVKVTIAVSNDFAKRDPEFCEFLSKYHTTSAMISEVLAYMQDNKADTETAAKWFLTEHDELLDQWLTPEQALIVRESLGTAKSDKAGFSFKWLKDFPLTLNIDKDAIDTSVRAFAVKHSGFFDMISDGLKVMTVAVQSILDFIPWWILILLVILAGKYVSGKWRTALLYGIMLSVVGFLGMWGEMNVTLSIIIVSVIFSLLIGFPVGILIAGSRKANAIVRPILDTMQTMPVYVYLIPAMLLFGLGKAPATIATVIYSVVPMIRLTSLGIRQVDAEVVEAARSFGSTRMQLLAKVQIPQAIPTIMSGVNQTIMLAMSMVVTGSLIGVPGLGMEVIIGLNRSEVGRGLIGGIAVVIIAILLDRLTQGMIKDKKVKAENRRTKVIPFWGAVTKKNEETTPEDTPQEVNENGK